METKKQEEKKIQYIICRVCGYIETADNADKPCPACGFPKTVWAEYTPRKLNPTRKRLLDLHLHPIAVHFPIAGSALTVGLPILGLLVPYSLGYRLFDFAMMVCLVMPLLVLIGGISGYIGGKLRYKTTTAPVLKFTGYCRHRCFSIALCRYFGQKRFSLVCRFIRTIRTRLNLIICIVKCIKYRWSVLFSCC